MRITILLFVCTVMISVIACFTASSSSSSLIFSPHENKCSQDKQWFCFNSTTRAYSCNQTAALSWHIICSENGPLLDIGSCATFDGNTRVLSISKCSNEFKVSQYNVSDSNYILLPTVLTELNNYMCSPLNRKGLVCSECADGFGPSVTSFGQRCVNCSDAWYGVPLFLLLKLVPITVLYLIILAFQISVTSAPMPCFIMYAQTISTVFDLRYSASPLIASTILKNNGTVSVFAKIIDAIYGMFHLDFLHLTIPPFCTSSRLKPIHVAFIGYISLFYPILLIFLTWICVELHGRNFRPLVWLWKPFHGCFVRLRRGWDTKSDIIDVFTTFIILSYSTVVYQTVQMVGSVALEIVNASGMYSVSLLPSVDQNLSYSDVHYYLFVIPSLLIFIVFNILPPLLLILYPIKAFRSCLSKCHLDITILNIFIEKLHGCYRNGLDGGRDMRSFSGLFFLLQIFAYLAEALAKTKGYFQPFFLSGILFSCVALTIALVKPHKRIYMTCLDSLILFNLAVLCFIISYKVQTIPIFQILLLIPIIVFIAVIFERKIIHRLYMKIKGCSRDNQPLPTLNVQPTESSTADNPRLTQPLIQPSLTALSYGTMQ